MTALDLQTEIMQLLREERNTSVLEAIRTLLRRGEVDGDEDFTEEELAELDKRRAAYLRGEGTSITAEESIQRLRSAQG